MTEIYQAVDANLYGPVSVTNINNENTKITIDVKKSIAMIWKEEEELLIRIRNRIIETVENLSQTRQGHEKLSDN